MNKRLPPPVSVSPVGEAPQDRSHRAAGHPLRCSSVKLNYFSLSERDSVTDNKIAGNVSAHTHYTPRLYHVHYIVEFKGTFFSSFLIVNTSTHRENKHVCSVC